MDKTLEYIAKKKRLAVAAGVGIFLLLAALVRIWRASVHPAAQPAAGLAGLYSGKESQRKVELYFAAQAKALPESEEAAVYATPLLVNQAKQVVLDLITGPKSKGLLPVFPSRADLRELFIDKNGLCVVDFDSSLRSGHPSGTTAEFLTLYCLTRSLTENFKEILKVQVIFDGQRAETLAGHFDISSPLDMNSF